LIAEREIGYLFADIYFLDIVSNLEQENPSAKKTGLPGFPFSFFAALKNVLKKKIFFVAGVFSDPLLS